MTRRRRYLRYRFNTLVKFSWKSSPKTCSQWEGVTRDIGGGAFIITSKCPPEKAKVHLSIFLPELCFPAHGGQIVSAEGRVIRVEHSPGGKAQNGFAVISKNLTLDKIASRLSHSPRPYWRIELAV